MKLPQFLIAKNPLASKRVFILHTQEPRFLAEVLRSKYMERVNELAQEYDFGTRTHPINGVHYIAVVLELYDNKGERFEKIMSRMGDWLFNYVTNSKNAF